MIMIMIMMIMPKIVNLFSNKIKKKKNYKTRFTVIKETKGKNNIQ